MIVITGNANREHATKNMTQETRQLEVLRPVVKEVIRVEVIRRIPEHVRRAFAVATSGRPGPVLIDEAERPLILAGGGVHISAAYDALRNFAESQGMPVAHTMSGKGALPCTHP